MERHVIPTGNDFVLPRRYEYFRPRLPRHPLINLPNSLGPLIWLRERSDAASRKDHRADESDRHLTDRKTFLVKLGKVLFAEILTIVRCTKMRLCLIEAT